MRCSAELYSLILGEIFETEQDDVNLQTQAMIWLYAPRLFR
jgi:hypothetical protein